jgi:hypothetical protein
MKRFYTLFLGLILLMGFEFNSNGQSLEVSGTLFLPQDSIGFTYVSPGFDSLDWIGIYHIGDAPGGPPSVTWDYILPQETGTIYLDAPQDSGLYKAFLLCCDGYDTIAISPEFRVAFPQLVSSSTVYLEGDSIVFTYVSPKFSVTDWIGIYPTGTKPGSENPSIDWDYIPDSSGILTFKTALVPGVYDAYLLCCDGYDSISGCTFEVISANTAFVTPVSSSFEAGVPIEISYNDPSYADGDWIGIYFEGDDPDLVSSVAWTNVESKSGTVSFPGTLSGGTYYAVLFCCGSSETKYAESAVFTVEAGASGTYIKTVASVYPEGVNILVNYRNPDLQDKDWIGIYNKGDAPGGPESLDWQYVSADSGTIEFSTVLTPGEYVVYLLCCDGYQIKAKYNFKIADASTPTIVAASMTFAANDSLVFHYNSPDWVDTDWIGIYNPGDVPGDIGSITWDYLPQTSGTLVFPPDQHGLEPGEYWAGLFCCDGYDLYAQVSFIVTDTVATGINNVLERSGISLYPNPSDGNVSLRTKNGEKIYSIAIYSLTGKVMYQEKLPVMVEEMTFELGFLNKGIYIVEAQTDKSPMTVKLIIQ